VTEALRTIGAERSAAVALLQREQAARTFVRGAGARLVAAPRGACAHSEWAKEDREIEGGKPDLAEAEEDPSEL
jgi:hypothetical protein